MSIIKKPQEKWSEEILIWDFIVLFSGHFSLKVLEFKEYIGIGIGQGLRKPIVRSVNCNALLFIINLSRIIYSIFYEVTNFLKQNRKK